MVSNLQLKHHTPTAEGSRLVTAPPQIDPGVRGNAKANKLDPQDRAFHDWYRFVLSFPPHLVRQYITEFGLAGDDVVMDPFCGTGTTIVEARKLGVLAVGLEANPVAQFACTTKLDWTVEPDSLRSLAEQVAAEARSVLRRDGIDDDVLFSGAMAALNLRTLDAVREKLLLTNSIGPVPLHKALVLLDCLRKRQAVPGYNHAMLALADVLVNSASNLHFGPEVGVGKIKQDAPLFDPWLKKISNIINDLTHPPISASDAATVYLADARRVGEFIKPAPVSAVITSPPCPNEKDYTRTTRLESVLLGFVSTRDDLRALKRGLVRSNTRGVYKEDDDGQWVAKHPEINRIADEIEARRISMGKTSGFERMYARVTRLYFGGMARCLAELRPLLKPGARLAYAVGDQASYLRVMIRTGTLLADIAQSLGYELERIDLFRTRLATASREQLREEVVILRWPKRMRR